MQYVVPVAVIRKDDKLLLAFKHSTSFVHCRNKWELPGGRAKFGQRLEESLKANTKRLLGVDVEVGELVGIIHSVLSGQDGSDEPVQFYVIPAHCTIASEEFTLDTSKLREVRWFTLPEIEELHAKGELVDSGDLQTARRVLQ